MPGVGAGVGHVHFMFFVLISFAFCSQRKPSFRWNMGLRRKHLRIHDVIISLHVYQFHIFDNKRFFNRSLKSNKLCSEKKQLSSNKMRTYYGKHKEP